MKSYIGVKIIEAEPAKNDKQMGAYAPGSDGYKVRYEDGYTSWSPKEVFEKAYFPMGDDPSKVTQEMINGFMGQVKTSQFDEKTSITVANTISGFRQYEVSSCVDPKNFDMKIGHEIGLKRIENTLWKCLGFVLQWGRFGLKKD